MNVEKKKMILLDYKNSFSKEQIIQIHDIMQGTHNTAGDVMFYVTRNKSNYHYFSCTCGFNKKIQTNNRRITYEIETEIKRLRNKCDCGNQTIEIEIGDDDFYNCGYKFSIIKKEINCMEMNLIPYGIRIEDDVISLEQGDYSYYISYDKDSNRIWLEREELLEQYYEEPVREAVYLSQYSNYDEDMGFGYEFPMTKDVEEQIFKNLKEYIPTLSDDFRYDHFFDMVLYLQLQQQYPIISNPKTFSFFKNHVGNIKVCEILMKQLQANGFKPQMYGVESCFDIREDDFSKIRSIEDIYVYKEWMALITVNKLKYLLASYKEVNGIVADMNNISLMLNFTKENICDFASYIKYIYRGAIAEGISLYDAISETNRYFQDGLITNFSGKYSRLVKRKKEITSRSRIPVDILNKLEKKPTLDNVYKLLINE